MKIKVLSAEERRGAKCWFCGANKSVKYAAQMVNTNPLSSLKYMDILVCNKCAANHMGDFVEVSGS